MTAEWRDDGLPFECRVELADGAVRVVPIGELDLDTTPLLEPCLDDARAAGVGRIVLDLTETTFIDSTALHLAMAWHERARRDGFTFALTRGPAAVRRTIDAAGIGAVLTFVDAAP